SLRTASSPPPRPPLENHPPVHQITPQVFHSTPSSPRPPTSRMRLNRRESIDTSRSHPPTFNTNTKKRASRKHQLLPPESFNRPPTRSQPPQPKQDRITKNQPRKRNQTLKWSLGTKSRQRWNCRSLHKFCQEPSSSQGKTLTHIHLHVGENYRSDHTALIQERNKKKGSHRRRHALRRAAGRRS
ncbi:unnamed protein product, partial [Brassica oleracea var. botrytis]